MRRLAVSTFVATTLASYVGTALSPYLLVEHPVLLLVLAPVGRHVALSAPLLPLPVLIAVVVLRRLVSLAAAWALGAIYGEAAVEWIEGRSARAGAFARSIEQLFARWGAPLLLFAPTHLLALLAGAAGTRMLAVLGLATAGELGWTLAAYYFGHAISDLTRPLLALLAEHLLVATLVSVGLVVLYHAVGRLRRRAH